LRIADYYKRMLPSLLSKGGLVALIICLLSASCQQAESRREQETRTVAYIALQEFVTETEIYVLDQPVTNASDFFKWIESCPSSTNKWAQNLRSACEIVWVNTNYNAWVSATTDHRSNSSVAMVAQYRVETNNRFIGAFFGTGWTREAEPPDSAFLKLDLKALTKKSEH